MESVAGRRIWQIFFVLSWGVVAWFLMQFVIKMIPYIGLAYTTSGVVESFVVEEKANEKWAITATYLYEVRGAQYKENYTFTAPMFPNRLAAQSHIDKHWSTKKEWQVWYSYKDPSKASLQKLFPFKLLFNTCLALGIVFYFVWLRHYAARVR